MRWRDPARRSSKGRVRRDRAAALASKTAVPQIDQKRHALAGVAAFQAKLDATRRLVPARRGDVQLPPLRRTHRDRQIQIFGPRQLDFGKPAAAQISGHSQPHFLLRDGNQRGRARPSTGVFGRVLGSRLTDPGKEDSPPNGNESTYCVSVASTLNPEIPPAGMKVVPKSTKIT